jgi:putative acetyltransferase
MPATRFRVREEKPDDKTEVRRVNEAAFGRPDEADLVDRLREEGAILASLVAEVVTQIVGHILFSRMWIETTESHVEAVALAPMAVMPEHQRHGIGGAMIRAGLDLLRARGEAIVIVLGHPNYYPRFGFSSEFTQSLQHPFRRDAYMALELQPAALAKVRGKIRYPAAFHL